MRMPGMTAEASLPAVGQPTSFYMSNQHDCAEGRADRIYPQQGCPWYLMAWCGPHMWTCAWYCSAARAAGGKSACLTCMTYCTLAHFIPGCDACSGSFC